MTEEVDDEIVAKISDFVDGLLSGAERDEVAAKIDKDETWKRTHAEILDTRKHLSDMRMKQRAPEAFTQKVTQTIHTRSAGRFFARRTLGDRVPFGVLLIFAVLALAVVGYLMWSSQTGSLKVDKHKPTPDQPSVTGPTP